MAVTSPRRPSHINSKKVGDRRQSCGCLRCKTASKKKKPHTAVYKFCNAMLTEMTVTSPYPKRFGGYTYKLPKLSEVVWRFNDLPVISLLLKP